MPKNSRFNLFLVLVFLVAFSGKLASIGAMVAQAMGDVAPILRTAIVVAIQTLAALLSLFIAKSKLVNFVNTWVFALFVGICSLALFVIPAVTGGWFLVFFFHQCAFYLISSLLVAGIPLFDKKRVVENNRKAQFIISSTFAISLGFSPLAVSMLGLRNMFLLQGILFLACTLPLRWISHMIRENVAAECTSPTSIAGDSGGSLYGFLHVFGLIFFVWLSAGVFNVLEIPLLISRFAFGAEELSLLFFAFAILNLIGIRSTPKELLKERPMLLFTVSSFLLLICSITYLMTYILLIVIAIVLAFGLSNGVFTVSYTTMLQSISREKTRNKALLVANLASKAGLLFATLFIFLAGASIQNIRPVVFLAASALVFALLTTLYGKLALPTRHSVMLSFCLLLLAASNACCENVIKFPVYNLPEKIDPKKLLFLSDAIISNQIFDTLYEFTPTNTLKPKLVKKHIIAKNGHVFRIVIDTEKKFSDGTRLDAWIVARSLRRTIAELGESMRWAVGKIEGFPEFVTNPKENVEKLGIQATSDSLLEIRLSKQFPLLLQILSSPYFSICHEHDGNLSGTGDYVLHERTEKHIKLVRSRPTAPPSDMPESIIFLLVKDSPEMNNAIRTGLVNFFDVAPDIKNIPNSMKIVPYDCLRSALLIINTKAPRFRDAVVRCRAIDMLSTGFKHSPYDFSSAFKAFPFGWDLFSRVCPPTEERIKMPPMTIHWSPSGVAHFNSKYNEFVKMALLRKGFKITFKKTTISKLTKKLQRGNFEAVLVGWMPDYIDPDALLYPAIGKNQQYNFARYNNPAIDALLDMERSMSDEHSRMIIFSKIFEILSTDCPLAFFGNQKTSLAIDKSWNVKSMSALGFYHFRFRNLRMRGK